MAKNSALPIIIGAGALLLLTGGGKKRSKAFPSGGNGSSVEPDPIDCPPLTPDPNYFIDLGDGPEPLFQTYVDPTNPQALSATQISALPMGSVITMLTRQVKDRQGSDPVSAAWVPIQLAIEWDDGSSPGSVIEPGEMFLRLHPVCSWRWAGKVFGGESLAHDPVSTKVDAASFEVGYFYPPGTTSP